jgi:sec-independent protein translocase protein TatA
MNLPGGWELVLVVLVIMVLFGAKRLPEASRSLGRSMRIFKAETKGLRDDDDTTTTVHDTTYVQTPVAPPAPIVPPVPQASTPQPEQSQPRQP